jgi:protein-S-isoprenylcysteine O-methyltransferase Ste14
MDKTGEILFRIVFGILWLVYFGVRIYFQRKVKGVGDYVRVNEKQEIFFFRLFALGYLALLLYFITPWVDFAHIPSPIWLRWAGGVVTCLGIGLFAWAHQALGKNWTAILASSEKQKMVITGPYRHVRHPMYTAFFVIGFGFLFLSANWFVSIIYLGTLTMMYMARVSAEEKMMIDHFGNDYREYMKRTGRLLPRFRD